MLSSGDYIEFDELCQRIAGHWHMNVNYLKDVLQSPLTKVRSMLCYREMIVQPDDRTLRCLYRTDLVFVMLGYVRWHRFGTRRTVVATVDFFNSFLRGEEDALSYLPPAALKKYRAMLENAVPHTAKTPQVAGSAVLSLVRKTA